MSNREHPAFVWSSIGREGSASRSSPSLQKANSPLLVGSPHDKSRQQAWCMGPTTSFSRHASHFIQSYVIFRDTGHSFFFFFLKRPAYYAAYYLPNVYASLRGLTFFPDQTKRIARFLHHHFETTLLLFLKRNS